MSVVADLHVESFDDCSNEDIETAARQLRSELLALDVEAVEFRESPAPGNAKGAAIGLADLAVTLVASGSALTVMLQTVRDWLSRRGQKQSVTITIGNDTLRLDDVSDVERDEIVKVFVQKHSAD
ncbi:effector-associated constant component EACC1 [Actinomycetospora sp. C-140]